MYRLKYHDRCPSCKKVWPEDDILDQLPSTLSTGVHTWLCDCSQMLQVKIQAKLTFWIVPDSFGKHKENCD